MLSSYIRLIIGLYFLYSNNSIENLKNNLDFGITQKNSNGLYMTRRKVTIEVITL